MPKQTKKVGDRYEIVGLEKTETMPVRFEGRDYDLANLTADEADYLLQHPEQVPYLRKLDVSQPDV